jgi:hypothetical protein
MEIHVREAQPEEIKQLKDELTIEYGGENDVDIRENIDNWVDNACIAVFPNYMTDGPGYSGKLLVIVFAGDSDQVVTYIWHQGRIIRAQS